MNQEAIRAPQAEEPEAQIDLVDALRGICRQRDHTITGKDDAYWKVSLERAFNELKTHAQFDEVSIRKMLSGFPQAIPALVETIPHEFTAVARWNNMFQLYQGAFSLVVGLAHTGKLLLTGSRLYPSISTQRQTIPKGFFFENRRTGQSFFVHPFESKIHRGIYNTPEPNDEIWFDVRMESGDLDRLNEESKKRTRGDVATARESDVVSFVRSQIQKSPGTRTHSKAVFRRMCTEAFPSFKTVTKKNLLIHLTQLRSGAGMA